MPSGTPTRRYLMCAPTHFAVSYRINPWMQPDTPVDVGRANREWQQLHDLLHDLGHHIDLVPPAPGLPDMVFAANGGIVIGDRALVPRFRYAERDGETGHFAAALRALGLAHVRQAEHVNEGEGDFLLTGDVLLAGHGVRTNQRAVDEVEEYFGIAVVALHLTDPRFYHLDTALARLDENTIAYWPGAFTAECVTVLDHLFPDAIVATEDDAAALALNMVSDGASVIMTPGRDRLAAQIGERGFEVVTLATDELRKAGGGAKCCVLELHDRPDALR